MKGLGADKGHMNITLSQPHCRGRRRPELQLPACRGARKPPPTAARCIVADESGLGRRALGKREGRAGTAQGSGGWRGLKMHTAWMTHSVRRQLLRLGGRRSVHDRRDRTAGLGTKSELNLSSPQVSAQCCLRAAPAWPCLTTLRQWHHAGK